MPRIGRCEMVGRVACPKVGSPPEAGPRPKAVHPPRVAPSRVRTLEQVLVIGQPRSGCGIVAPSDGVAWPRPDGLALSAMGREPDRFETERQHV